MRTVYKVLAYAVAVEVVIQAMAIVWAIAGLGKWVSDGGVLDKSVMESEDMAFPEVAGLIVHGLNGGMLIPLIALLLLISSFFAKVPRGVRFAAIVFVLVGVQAMLGYSGHELPAIGALHGLNALVLFTTALYTARRVKTTAASPSAQTPDQVATGV
jgi:heme A synthase